MATTLPLIGKRIDLEEALDSDHNYLHELAYPEKRLKLWYLLFKSRPQIADIAALHLTIPVSDITVSEPEEWIHGSFNACIPIAIARDRHASLPDKLILRVPLAYKNGEEFFEGNGQEKVKCEAATYAWLHDKADIQVPRLFGFGVTGGRSANLSDGSTFQFFDREALPNISYLLIEFIKHGKTLSKSWGDHRSDPTRRENLYRQLSRLILGLAKVALPRIGSWTVNDDGKLVLSNRPLTWNLQQQENFGVETGIAREQTYTASDSYYLDLLLTLDHRIRGIPNSIHNEGDGRLQLSKLTAMRALLPHYLDRKLRGGPYIMTLTDLHHGNIFVDDDWNITAIIDLEWTCVRPVEMLAAPFWLSNGTLEEIAGDDKYREYGVFLEKFLSILEEEEVQRYESNETAKILKANWTSGAFWYFSILDNPTLLDKVFRCRIGPGFMRQDKDAAVAFERVMPSFWCEGVEEFLAEKVKDQERYNQKIQDAFAAASLSSEDPPRTEANGK